jgi:hypothetical protein
MGRPTHFRSELYARRDRRASATDSAGVNVFGGLSCRPGARGRRLPGGAACILAG